MKPKPLESLNHFTVPVAIDSSLKLAAATNPGATKPGTKNHVGERSCGRCGIADIAEGRRIRCSIIIRRDKSYHHFRALRRTAGGSGSGSAVWYLTCLS